MNMELSFEGEKRFWFWRKKILPGVFKEILVTLKAELNLEIKYCGKQKYTLKFCPLGVLEIEVKGNRLLRGNAQLLIAGPGFHKKIVDFLAILAEKLGIFLKVGDPSNYWDNRDFTKLKQYYIDWLARQVDKVTSNLNREEESIWPFANWRPAKSYSYYTPMGSFTVYGLKTIIQEERFLEFAREYFIWFNADQDAYYYRGLALYLLWNEFCFVSPRNEVERELQEELLGYLEKARQLDPNIALPVTEWKQLVRFAEDELELEIKGPVLRNSGQIGYRRGEILAIFPDRWEVKLPGSFYHLNEEEELVYGDENRKFRLKAYSYREKYQSLFEKILGETKLAEAESLEFVRDNYTYQAKYGYYKDLKAELSYWLLHGKIVVGSAKIALVTITWKHERWTKWAINLFQNIKGPK